MDTDNRIPLENNIFSWEDWNDEGPMSMQFGGVELKVQVGEFPAGTKFPTAFILGEHSILALYDEEGTEHAFDLKLSAGEKLSTSTQEELNQKLNDHHCDCGHDH